MGIGSLLFWLFLLELAELLRDSTSANWEVLGLYSVRQLQPMQEEQFVDSLALSGVAF